ncbi:MAG: cytochrome c oxidase subunit II [Acidimicrobiales bacterium]
MLEPAGPSAGVVADLWWLMLALGTAVFVLVVALLAVGVVRSGRGDTGDWRSRSSWWLLGGGVALPSVVITVVLVATVATMRALPDEAGATPGLAIEVTGRQWQWDVVYPDHGVRSVDEVHLPAGEPVLLRLRSADVIHSFWVPALAGKMDALPDHENTLIVEADEPGTYSGVCAEFCGVGHTAMRITVVVHDRAGFDNWIETGALSG